MYSAHETFSNSPIEEVVFDIEFASTSEFDTRRLDNFADDIANYFPKKAVLSGGQSRSTEVTPRIAVAETSRTILCQNAAGNEFLRLSGSSVSFSNVNGYAGWSAFFPMAQIIWKVYTENIQPGNARRLGLRYINRFKPPIVRPFGHWLTSYLTLPSIKGGNVVRHYYTSVVLPQGDLSATELAIRTVLLDDPTSVTNSAFILDFDIYRTGSWTLSEGNALFGIFGDMHERIYEAFTASLTPAALELIR